MEHDTLRVFYRREFSSSREPGVSAISDDSLAKAIRCCGYGVASNNNASFGNPVSNRFDTFHFLLRVIIFDCKCCIIATNTGRTSHTLTNRYRLHIQVGEQQLFHPACGTLISHFVSHFHTF